MIEVQVFETCKVGELRLGRRCLQMLLDWSRILIVVSMCPGGVSTLHDDSRKVQNQSEKSLTFSKSLEKVPILAELRCGGLRLPKPALLPKAPLY